MRRDRGNYFNRSKQREQSKQKYKMKLSNEEQALVDKAKEGLLEHFDSVRIFVTKHNGSEDETESYESGGGNFYAQLGQVHEWLCIQEQYQRNYAVRKDEESQ